MPRVPLSVMRSPAFNVLPSADSVQPLPPAWLNFSWLVPREVTDRVPQHGPRVHSALFVLIAGRGELAVVV